MVINDLLQDPELGLRPLAWAERLDRRLSGVFVTDLPDPTPYLKGGELVLTGLMWRRGPYDSDPFVSGLTGRGVTALAAGEAVVPVPDDLVEACERHGLPLVAVPRHTPLSALMQIVLRRLDLERHGAAPPLGSHRGLLGRLPEDVRRTFRHQVLGQIAEYDRRSHSDLLGTLQVFLECSGSWTVCARRLHMHVNTLRYRINRIEELTGRDLSSLEDRVDLLLALRS
ncbi:PucR family transcriptional regulator [Actinomadura kijaniata]|uniref:PucR family transcriptional regulator n=1 Tax=Actinomadura kijaniata TaxID=46161 RepID=UPI003F1AB589